MIMLQANYLQRANEKQKDRYKRHPGRQKNLQGIHCKEERERENSGNLTAEK